MAVAATALIVFPPTYDNFNLPKGVWLKVLTELLAALTLCRFALGGDFRIRVHWLNALLLLFLTWKALSWSWAESRSLAADDIRFWATLALWAFLFQDWLRDDSKRLARCAVALMVSATTLALWVLVQDFAVAFYGDWVARLVHVPGAVRDPLRWLVDRLTGAQVLVPKLPDWRGRLWAGLGNTNHIADYLAFVFPMTAMAYLAAERALSKVALGAALAATSAALIACYSVGSNGGLILAMVVFTWLAVRHETARFWRSRAIRLAAIAAVFAAVTAFYVLPHGLNPHAGGIFRQAFASQRWREGWPTRLAIWLNSLEIIRHHPLLGAGTGNFTYAYTATLSPKLLERPDLARWAGAYTNAAHNEPIQAWVETGAVGLALLLLLWAATARAALAGLSATRDVVERRRRTAILAMLVAFIGHSMMNFTLQLPTSSLLFVGLVSVAACLGRRRGEFPLTIRSSYGPLDIDLETTGMKHVESVGFRLALPRPAVRAIIVVGVLVTATAVAVSLRPLVADSLFNRAKRARLAGIPGVAENWARRALAINPDHHHARKLLGRVLLERGRYAEAVDALEKVTERETVYDFYKELGWGYWNLGQREKAGRAWATYFARCPALRKADAEFFAFFAGQFPDLAPQTSAPTRQ